MCLEEEAEQVSWESCQTAGVGWVVVGSPALDSRLASCGVTLVDVMCVPIGICLVSLCLHGLGLDFSRSYGPGQPHVFLIMAAISGELPSPALQPSKASSWENVECLSEELGSQQLRDPGGQ